ncbi:hypothetical protein, partial [Natrialba sp. PRR66]
LTRFDEVLRITNTNGQEADVWVTDPSNRVTFYETEDGNREPIEGPQNQVGLDPGEDMLVGLSVDTKGGTVDFDGTLTIHANIAEDDDPGTTTTPTTIRTTTAPTTTGTTTTEPTTTE